VAGCGGEKLEVTPYEEKKVREHLRVILAFLFPGLIASSLVPFDESSRHTHYHWRQWK